MLEQLDGITNEPRVRFDTPMWDEMSHVPAAVERNIRSVVEDDVVSVNNAVSFLTEDAD